LTRNLDIGLYRETLCLQFETGQLVRVDSARSSGQESIRIPSEQFIRLLLGSSSWDDLEARHPDVSSVPIDRMLMDVLFPGVDAFLYQPY
jgi:hypothetical protein